MLGLVAAGSGVSVGVAVGVRDGVAVGDGDWDGDAVGSGVWLGDGVMVAVGFWVGAPVSVGSAERTATGVLGSVDVPKSWNASEMAATTISPTTPNAIKLGPRVRQNDPGSVSICSWSSNGSMLTAAILQIHRRCLAQMRLIPPVRTQVERRNVHLKPGIVIVFADGEQETKRRSNAHFTVYPDTSTVRLDQRFGD
jgi:hypothetical protein